MKPVSIVELKKAIDRVSGVLIEKNENKKLKILVQNLKNPYQSPKIALPTSEALNFVAIEDIIRCKAENNYTLFFLANGNEILVSKTLKELEELLVEHQFIRTHQSHLINAKHVKSYVKKDGGYILMKDNSIVSVSKSRKESTLNGLMSIKQN